MTILLILAIIIFITTMASVPWLFEWNLKRELKECEKRS